MNRHPKFYSILAAGLILLTVGCTRQADKSTLSLRMDVGGATSEKSSLAVSGQLNFFVINVRPSSGGLIVKTVEYRDSAPAGNTISLDIPNVPRGSVFVQFFGVYEDSSNAMQRFAYGDATVSASTSEVPVSIVPAEVGAATKEGRFSGRYIDRINPENGPTGNLILEYVPPGKPAVSIEKRPIVDGWFSLFMLDGAPLNYRFEETGEVLFNQVQLSASNLVINGATVATGNHLVRFSKPVSFRKDGNETKAMPPAEVFVGYMQKSGLNVLGTKQVCFANDVNEAIPGLYTSSAFTTPMDFVSSGSGLASDMRWIGGGVGATQATVYKDTATACTATGANKFLLYHPLIGTDNDGAAGISPPFQAVSAFRRWDNFIDSKFSVVNGNATITVEWSLLPSIASMDGVAVFAKYEGNSGGGGGDGGDHSCSKLAEDGYTEVSRVTPLSTTSYAFTGAGGQLVTAANYWGWSFALCGFKTQADSTTKWIGQYVRGGRVSGDGDQFHMGWAPASAVTVGTTSVSYTTMGGHTNRVSGVTTSNSRYTTLTLDYTVSNISPGDEVMLHVTGHNGALPCGAYYGNSITAGTYGFARVIAASGSTLDVVKGTLADHLLTANLATAPSNAGTFCFVQLVKVLQYRALDLSSTTTFDQLSGVDLSSTLGGIIPIRVNGLLAMGATVVSTNGAGFVGGGSIGKNGAGVNGPRSAAASSGSGGGGGGSSETGAGGGGYGSGGNGNATAQGGSGSNSWGNWWRVVLGGGGGAGNITSPTGGAGGGSIFLMAREITVSGASVLSADGANGGSSTFGGGGGGGGSVILISRKVSGAGSLALTSTGGSGGIGTAGVGGGGSVQSLICDRQIAADPTVNVDKGSSGNTTAASNGSSQLYSPSGQFQCQSSD